MALATAPTSNALSPAVRATNPEAKAAAIVNPAVVYIGIDAQYYLDTGNSGAGYIGPYELQGSCTGVNVSSDGYIETAGHCVDVSAGSDLWNSAIQNGLQSEVNAETITTDEANQLLEEALSLWKVEGATAGRPAQLTITVGVPLGVSGQQGSTGKTARIVEAKSFDDGDIALIKTETTNAPIVQLGSDSAVDIGTPVLAVGYPGAEDGIVDPTLSPTFKDGQINAKTTRAGLRVPVYEMSADLSPGMSGGPTVSLDGKLVGINSFVSAAKESFGFISPVSLVQEQLSRNNVKNVLTPVDTNYRTGLNSYFSGDYQAAVTAFDKVLGIAPGHFYAQQYKQKASEKLANAPATTAAPTKTTTTKSDDKKSGSGTLLIVVGILVVLVLLAVVLLIVMKGRGQKGTPGAQAPGIPGYGAAPMPGTPPGSVPPQPTMPMAPAPMAPAPGVTAPPPAPAPMTPPAAPAPTPASAATTESVAAATAVCSSCGRNVNAGERFCPSCGHDLPQ